MAPVITPPIRMFPAADISTFASPAVRLDLLVPTPLRGQRRARRAGCLLKVVNGLVPLSDVDGRNGEAAVVRLGLAGEVVGTGDAHEVRLGRDVLVDLLRGGTDPVLLQRVDDEQA